ncbi:MAG: hypothetical protein U5P10_09285 [Spirochaetia bacterium]|nr:hypothetical protein [Spirochaetia bacterium]
MQLISHLQYAAATNFQYAYNAYGEFVEDDDLREKINIGGLIYWNVIDKSRSSGSYYLWEKVD